MNPRGDLVMRVEHFPATATPLPQKKANAPTTDRGDAASSYSNEQKNATQDNTAYLLAKWPANLIYERHSGTALGFQWKFIRVIAFAILTVLRQPGRGPRD